MCKADLTPSVGDVASGLPDLAATLVMRGFVPFCYVMAFGLVLEHLVLLAEIAGGIATAAGLILAAAVAISRRANRRVLVQTTPTFRARLAAAERRPALPAARRRALPRPVRAIPAAPRALEGTVYDPAGRRVWVPPVRGGKR